jgi:hypothetical protein
MISRRTTGSVSNFFIFENNLEVRYSHIHAQLSAAGNHQDLYQIDRVHKISMDLSPDKSKSDAINDN